MKLAVFTHAVTVMVLTAALGALPPAPLRAEEQGSRLSEIVAIARENNGNLRALRAEVGIGEAGKLKAGLYPNPVLELEGTSGALTGSSAENRLSIGVSQEFLTGRKREKRLAVVESELLRFGSRVKDAERLLLLEVKSGFYGLLLAEGRLELANKSLELNSQLLQVAKERLAAGDVAELDVNLAKVETARSMGRKIEAERELVPARQRLLSLMGAPAGDTLKVAASAAPTGLVPDLAALTALAMKNRPDLLAVAAEKEQSEAELSLARAEQLPNVTAGIAVSRESSETSLGGLSEQTTDYLIGLKLSVPLPFFDRNQAAVKAAQAKKSSAEIRRMQTRQQIEREVAAAHARFVAEEKALAIYADDIIPQLTENLQLVQEAYRLGETGMLAVIEEQKKFIEVNEGYLAAQFGRNSALVQLEATAGSEFGSIDGGKK